MPGRRWKPEEVDLLDSLANYCSGVELTRRYQQKAEKLGLPYRTPKAIHGKALIEYGTVKALYDNHNASCLAKMLGLKKLDVFRWIDRGHLKATRKGKFLQIRNVDFKAFALARPDLARRADVDGLAFFVGREKAIAIKQSDPPKNTPKPVVYVPEGKVFPSICEAARQTYWSDRTIRKYLSENHPDWRLAS